jgi:hypothetical protein
LYNWWRVSSHGAYSSLIPQAGALQRLSTASFVWMFTNREIFMDSGWAHAFRDQSNDRTNYMASLGFETNNPIHDDHDGRGPHFHMTLRSNDKDKMRSPAFYLNPDDGTLSLTLGTNAVELTASSLFGVQRHGPALAIGPIVRLKNVRSKMYVYVRESEQGTNHVLRQD